jgi:hypothetical protein
MQYLDKVSKPVLLICHSYMGSLLSFSFFSPIMIIHSDSFVSKEEEYTDRPHLAGYPERIRYCHTLDRVNTVWLNNKILAADIIAVC